MDITLTVDGESYSYHIEDDPEQERVDFMDAVVGFEGMLKAAFPSFEGHDLVALCPDGSVHEGMDDDDGGQPTGTNGDKKPDADGGIDLGKKS
ncbi:Uncharacterised protein [uncultured archaeon]|nr:Uncharacterised protein [uncultured archaeon]